MGFDAKWKCDNHKCRSKEPAEGHMDLEDNIPDGWTVSYIYPDIRTRIVTCSPRCTAKFFKRLSKLARR